MAKQNVKYYNKENSYSLGRPSGSMEKEILEKVTFKNATSEKYFVGNFGWKTPQGKTADGYLYSLDEYDQNLVKNIKLKTGEKVFRYVNRSSALGGMSPLIKINLDKGLLYFPIHNDNDDIVFEGKGVSALWINIIEDKMAKGGGVEGVFIEFKKDSPQEWQLVEWSLNGHTPSFRGKMYYQKGTGFMFVEKEDGQTWKPQSNNKLFWRKISEYAKGGGVGKTFTYEVKQNKWTLFPNNRYYRRFFIPKSDSNSYREITEHGVTEEIVEQNDIYDITISVTKQGKEYFEKTYKGKYANGGGVGKNYEVELFFKGLSEEREVGKYVISEKSLERLEEEYGHIFSIDVIDETSRKAMTYYDLKKEIWQKGRDRGFYANGGGVGSQFEYTIGGL